MRRLRSFLALTRFQRRLVIEAAGLTGAARLAILTLPFRRIAPWLGRHRAASAPEAELKSNELICQVRLAVGVASRNVPWQAKCLVQAMAARSMLRRRGVSGTIYMGMAKEGLSGAVKAHAWLRSGNIIVTGRRGMRAFAVVSTFAFGRDDCGQLSNPTGKRERTRRPRSRFGLRLRESKPSHECENVPG